MRWLINFSCIALLACNFAEANNDNRSVIYGADNRQELFQVKSEVRALAASVMAIVEPEYLHKESNGDYLYKSESYQKYYGLCSSERFVEQNTAASCTGFLVAPDLMATAGHCIVSKSNCQKLRFIFDYAYFENGVEPVRAKAKDVYRCKNIVAIRDTWTVDYAIVRLDRPVVGRTPLILNSRGRPQSGEPLFIIGHSSGLPMKIADGASVRSFGQGYFTANLDSNGGNSGSPVFSARSGAVEGIMVRGEDDFVRHGSCNVSKICANQACVGQDVTNIAEVLRHL